MISVTSMPSRGPDHCSYTRTERMVIEASRRIHNGDTVFVGAGIALACAMLAQRTHAPEVTFLLDSGAVGPEFDALPMSVTDRHVAHRAIHLGGMRDVLGCLIRRVDTLALLGAAEIDEYANINSSYVKEGDTTIRLPGAGGATAATWHANRILLLARHELRRFPRRCHFISSPGYIDGAASRARLGIGVPAPAITVVTDLCVMEIGTQTGRLMLTHLMPDVTEEDVLAKTGFQPVVVRPLARVQPPSDRELSVLRQDVDPNGVYLRPPMHSAEGQRAKA